MNLEIFLSTFGMIFLAELGDKTQLTAVALAARFPWKKTFVGLAAAFALLNAFAVAIGEGLFKVVPLGWIQAGSAALFLFFGASTLLSKDDDGDEDGEKNGKGKARGPVATAFTLILFAELGDKTQLATASLAAQHASPWTVFAGSTLALWLVSLIGLLVGAQVARRVPMVWVRRAAGVTFLGFGLWTAWSAVHTLRLVG
ncbi:MAG TPA: TMEM165/GDT1 family protein [Myxococcales bacterium]|jgi:putative Ca2+/H+ antiporter (TMEM165/GDT1 family)